MRQGDYFVETAGARLRVRCAGKGPLLALIHGWALDLDMWTPQFRELSDRFRVIAFDRRGFGLSSGEPHLQSDVDDLLFLLSRTHRGKAAVVGMSQGARVALRAALQAPDQVACVILDGPPDMSATSGDELPFLEYRKLVRTAGLDAFRKAWMSHPLVQLRSNDRQAQRLLRTMIERYSGADLLAPAQSAATLIERDDLTRLKAPALVINGEYDTETRRAAGAELARTLPNARLELMRDAAHLPNLDTPAVYNRAVGGFLRTCLCDSQSALTG